ncbi:tripeptidyl peptidase Sed3 [Aspergillus heteromorphus CBS 117.55]|uniref:tripeptidyl-peptidase II n=1 Tax=Aspergillus heteromorphus CBS 117.55 TaxID=1448321 RepID=A0A317X3E4_9EURO|nr:tripeptidyl peptidase Sed3 [Aspergillus heteromorphus CBS 117.55]PWY92671.1 tripeptidyl peptidase Sed3 [Aspergillus heteromorphus CBS 117.55]
MVLITYLIGTLSLLLTSLHPAVAAESKYVVVEQLSRVPDGWTQGVDPSPSTPMKFWLAIHHDNKAGFEQKVIEISTPGHHKYGRHMKRDEVRAFMRPSDQASTKVLAWLESEHVPSDSIENRGDWITFTVSLSQAQAMMRTDFHTFRYKGSGATQIRTLEYSVPADIHPYLQLIQPTTRFGKPKTQQSPPSLLPVTLSIEDLSKNCSVIMKPECLRQLYGIYDTKATPDPANTLGVSGYLDQYARYSDLEEFMKVLAPNDTNANFSVVSINGGLNLQNSLESSTEASLDIQYAIAVAYDANAIYYTTAGRGPSVPESGDPETEESSNEPYLEQLQYLLDLPDDELPAVLSTSYGEDEQTVPEEYMRATCSLFAKLGARGVSVIFSSGDSGVGESCISNNGTQARFQPLFPASCPFVTAVGGTEGLDPEKAIGFSGGGFSDVFTRPPYQNASVESYLKGLGDQWAGLFNPDGRGIPDVAAQARNYAILDHGTWLQSAGTSAATPVFAAIVSRLNAARLAQGKPKLGFLNPWLYSLNQTGFTDIVDGGSVGCDGLTGALVPYASWNATKGWDPVTGLGTPFFQTLEKIAQTA